MSHRHKNAAPSRWIWMLGLLNLSQCCYYNIIHIIIYNFLYILLSLLKTYTVNCYWMHELLYLYGYVCFCMLFIMQHSNFQSYFIWFCSISWSDFFMFLLLDILIACLSYRAIYWISIHLMFSTYMLINFLYFPKRTTLNIDLVSFMILLIYYSFLIICLIFVYSFYCEDNTQYRVLWCIVELL